MDIDDKNWLNLNDVVSDLSSHVNCEDDDEISTHELKSQINDVIYFLEIIEKNKLYKDIDHALVKQFIIDLTTAHDEVDSN